MGETDRSYTGTHAAFYEALTGANARGDVPFYVETARETEGPVLELACGTGRVYLDLLAAGVDGRAVHDTDEEEVNPGGDFAPVHASLFSR